MLQLEIKSYMRFQMKSLFKCFIGPPNPNPSLTHILKNVIPNCHFLRNLKFSLHNSYLSPRVSGVSGILYIALLQEMPQYQPMKYFEYNGQDREKCSTNGNHYIFSADLARMTKMFSLSCIYLYILICIQKLLHIGHFHCISFSLYF